MVVIGRERAPHNRAGRGEVNCELVRDGGMLHVGDTFRRKQRGENVAVLASFARGERGE